MREIVLRYLFDSNFIPPTVREEIIEFLVDFLAAETAIHEAVTACFPAWEAGLRLDLYGNGRADPTPSEKSFGALGEIDAELDSGIDQQLAPKPVPSSSKTVPFEFVNGTATTLRVRVTRKKKAQIFDGRVAPGQRTTLKIKLDKAQRDRLRRRKTVKIPLTVATYDAEGIPRPGAPPPPPAPPNVGNQINPERLMNSATRQLLVTPKRK